MLPPPKITLIPKPIYYLEERRKAKNEFNGAVSTRHKANNLIEDESLVSSLSAQNIKEVQKKASEFEKLARKQEIFLHKNPSTVFSIKKAASVDNLIISSIKAKLAIIDHLEKDIN